MTKSAATNPDVHADDVPFRHYTLKHRAIAWLSTHLFDQVTYTVRGGLLRGMKRRGGLGWAPSFLAGSAQTPEHEFWKSLDLRGKIVYDVGAFQGLLTLFFAPQAKQVVCYEPNQRNRRRLEENLSLNGLTNVRVRPFGAGAAHQKLKMVFNPLMPGGASVDSRIQEQLLKNDAGVVTEEIELTTLDTDIPMNNLPAPDFIKIDIEGWELDALTGARETLVKYRPDLFLEMHGETMNQKRQKVSAIVDYLTGLGCNQIVHVESGTTISPLNSNVAAEGHLYCQFS